MSKKLLYIIAMCSTIFAGEYLDSLINTDSCRTVSYNSLQATICTDDRNLLTRAAECADRLNLTLSEYVYTSILERIDYDEETFYFKKGCK